MLSVKILYWTKASDLFTITNIILCIPFINRFIINLTPEEVPFLKQGELFSSNIAA